MSAPYRPDYVEVIESATRLHGRCPHCTAPVAVIAPARGDLCASCHKPFALTDMLPVTRIAL
jgi:hypothetical protein